MKPFLILIGICILASGNVHAQKIDAASLKSIVNALQEQALKNPPVFPLESYQGGVQSIEEGLRQAYFGYGERRYTDRSDFHPAMDVGYFPKETGYVTTEQGESVEVRAPQTYLKKVYAIQKGEFVSIASSSYGYKIVLKHSLETPYYDNQGNAWHHYYTCYRHLDSRSLAYLDGVARTFTGDASATHEALSGKYVFEAGEQIAVVGFPPADNPDLPRAHLDFSLNVFDEPNKGANIRNYALNPLLLFPPFEYAEPQSFVKGSDGLPAYKFVADATGFVTPEKGKDGQFTIRIHCGGRPAGGEYTACRYFALNAVDLLLFNEGKRLGSHHIDRQRKLGYNTGSYESLDTPDPSVPHFLAPMREQEDVYEMTVILPAAWFKAQHYDWKKDGSLSVGISSIWKGYREGHSESFTIPLP